MNLSLVTENDPVLKQVTPKYQFTNSLEERQAIEEAMFTTMVANNGIGLAAPQVGRSERMFVMLMNDGTKLACYNPEVVDLNEESSAGVEGCLSFPMLYLAVKRPETITGKFQDTNGTEVLQSLHGIDARCFLHELDHLNGVVFTTKVGAASLQIAKQRQSKLKRTKRQ